MAARKLSRENIAEALRLREELGWSYNRIGLKFGVSGSAISWHCLIHGADKPGAIVTPRQAPGPEVMQRGNHLVRRYSPEEDEQIQRLAIEGVNTSEIARRLFRRPNSVRGRLATLARREERLEQKRI